MVMFFEHKEADKDNQTVDSICEYIEKKSSKEEIVWVFDNVEEVFEESDFARIESLLGKVLKKVV